MAKITKAFLLEGLKGESNRYKGKTDAAKKALERISWVDNIDVITAQLLENAALFQVYHAAWLHFKNNRDLYGLKEFSQNKLDEHEIKLQSSPSTSLMTKALRPELYKSLYGFELVSAWQHMVMFLSQLEIAED